MIYTAEVLFSHGRHGDAFASGEIHVAANGEGEAMECLSPETLADKSWLILPPLTCASITLKDSEGNFILWKEFDMFGGKDLGVFSAEDAYAFQTARFPNWVDRRERNGL